MWSDYALGVVIVANLLISVIALFNHQFFEQHIFSVRDILHSNEYSRIFTAGFLHANFLHLFFNMFALFSFGRVIAYQFGALRFLILYLGALILSNLFSLVMHRKDLQYRAVGASGAVSAVIYSAIILNPTGGISFIFFPVAIPSWIFGMLFLLISMFGMSHGLGRIGHDAHFAGSILGVIITIIYIPWIIRYEYLVISAILVPSLIFLLILAFKPEWIYRR